MLIQTIEIETKVDRREFLELAKEDPKKAAEAIEPEIEKFNKEWMSSRGGPLSTFEHQILREYLAWKMIGNPSGSNG